MDTLLLGEYRDIPHHWICNLANVCISLSVCLLVSLVTTVTVFAVDFVLSLTDQLVTATYFWYYSWM